MLGPTTPGSWELYSHRWEGTHGREAPGSQRAGSLPAGKPPHPGSLCPGEHRPSSPSGMMERYFPRNLLEMVISCQRLQPFLENTWCAADGGWWLT